LKLFLNINENYFGIISKNNGREILERIIGKISSIICSGLFQVIFHLSEIISGVIYKISVVTYALVLND